ncbi:YidC/Oxa1 family membrane protein insertase [Thermoflavimicrobium daqui]|uniref:Membrane insertase YidC/Oxa/ALB C-terminal domain-containing protein n=1 Tax=Thermoflavimicrobium daqui TaxID=2137476 RepID=A0A364K516_9BACL|nr:YidC/Oxa1 family membrane protein insertase [Thermoflavimicrobium daqui]RAL24359.1 hypothetical protein DL897_08510 [Thermoflavimicrobium daqui]
MINQLVEWVKPFFTLLEQAVGDWGLAVILFTLLVRLCLIPLSIRQSNFAVKQFLFSQHVAKLKEKWQGNQQKMTVEMTKVMSEKSFNPFSMLSTVILQTPIFMTIFALFHHLGPTAHSVFIPWVASIGLPDPYFIFPIVTAILCGLLSKVALIPDDMMTTTASNPMSFYIMVGFSLFILWSAPVAISLYYGTSSLWGAIERRLLRSRVRKLISQEQQQ